MKFDLVLFGLIFLSITIENPSENQRFVRFAYLLLLLFPSKSNFYTILIFGSQISQFYIGRKAISDVLALSNRKTPEYDE